AFDLAGIILRRNPYILCHAIPPQPSISRILEHPDDRLSRPATSACLWRFRPGRADVQTTDNLTNGQAIFDEPLKDDANRVSRGRIDVQPPPRPTSPGEFAWDRFASITE